jgi:hypothetical protein
MKLGLSAMNSAAPKSIVRKSAGPRRNLVFADELSYSACKGYHKPGNSCSSSQDTVSVQEPVTDDTLQNITSLSKDTNDRASNDPITSQADGHQHIAHDEAFEQMIDDMAFKVWKCGRCLSMTHLSRDCTNDIRCRACYSYGHIKKHCYKSSRQVKAQKWVPKASGPLPKGETSGVTPAVSASSDKVNSFIPPVAVVLPSSSTTPSLPPPSTTPNLDSSSSMAVYEVDPTPWLPWGHQVIDGGPTRLPRTFYYAAQDPLPYHHDFCIDVVEPVPPPADEVFWREQVLNFLVGPLNRNVLDNQPSLFGAGLFQLSSPNAVNALVQHGHYQLLNRFVRCWGDNPRYAKGMPNRMV